MKEGKKQIKTGKTEAKHETSSSGTASIQCIDRKCPFHGNVKTRGRTFRGDIVKIGNKNLAISFDRIRYIYKYERYERRKTKIYAHVPDCLASKIKVGDYVEIVECRPLSKTIHHVLISINTKEQKK
ncbi:MAG: 30S ribosomal protein S17 [archaeon]